MILVLTRSVFAVNKFWIVAVVLSDVKEEVVLALGEGRYSQSRVSEGHLLMNGTASNTEIVAGAVLGVREVGRRTVRIRTGDGVRTLTVHLQQQQADHQLSVSW